MAISFKRIFKLLNSCARSRGKSHHAVLSGLLSHCAFLYILTNAIAFRPWKACSISEKGNFTMCQEGHICPPHFQVGGTGITQPFPNWLRDHQRGTSSLQLSGNPYSIRILPETPVCLKGHPISQLSPGRSFTFLFIYKFICSLWN